MPSESPYIRDDQLARTGLRWFERNSNRRAFSWTGGHSSASTPEQLTDYTLGCDDGKHNDCNSSMLKGAASVRKSYPCARRSSNTSEGTVSTVRTTLVSGESFSNSTPAFRPVHSGLRYETEEHNIGLKQGRPTDRTLCRLLDCNVAVPLTQKRLDVTAQTRIVLGEEDFLLGRHKIGSPATLSCPLHNGSWSLEPCNLPSRGRCDRSSIKPRVCVCTAGAGGTGYRLSPWVSRSVQPSMNIFTNFSSAAEARCAAL
jgi:hypothetical protein